MRSRRPGRRLILGTIMAAGAGVGAAIISAAAVGTGLSAATAAVPVGLVVGSVVGAAAVVVAASRAETRRRARVERRMLTRMRGLATRLRETEGLVRESSAVSAFSAMNVPYPLPLGGRWALSWDAAVLLAREVGARRPEVVVELGAGGSSLVIGMQLRNAGHGHLYTIDHSEAFAAATRRHVEAHGLDSWVSVLEAPLVEQEFGGHNFRWYDLPRQIRALDRVDMLVVDGPPQATDRNGMPRYPALAAFADRLGPGSVVFVDDAYRDSDKAMLARWADEQPQWSSKVIKTKRGTAILVWPIDA